MKTVFQTEVARQATPAETCQRKQT